MNLKPTAQSKLPELYQVSIPNRDFMNLKQEPRVEQPKKPKTVSIPNRDFMNLKPVSLQDKLKEGLVSIPNRDFMNLKQVRQLLLYC